MENPACVYRWFPKGNPWVSYFARNYTHRLTSIWLNIGFHFFNGGYCRTHSDSHVFSTKDPGSHP